VRTLKFFRRIKCLKNLELTQKWLVFLAPVSPSDYLKATLIAEEKNLGVNDALAYVKMKELDIEEIYTFDRDFEKLDVRVVKV
jgi:predicted nucleic acid-binding protein